MMWNRASELSGQEIDAERQDHGVEQERDYSVRQDEPAP
jgi:hypothetical protein